MAGLIQTDTHTDRVTRALEQMIFDGAYADGDRLDEVQLAQKFGVSRTPVREAFQRLAQSGLVEQLPRRGVFVREPGPVELIEMFEVMAELEATCARLAAARISDLALADLRAANTACQEAASAADFDGYYAHNETFHHLIYAESGNSFLASETARLHRRLQPFRRMQLRLRGRMAQSLQEHEAIVDALSNGQTDRAAEVTRNHVAVQGEKFRHLVSARRAAR